MLHISNMANCIIQEIEAEIVHVNVSNYVIYINLWKELTVTERGVTGYVAETDDL